MGKCYCDYCDVFLTNDSVAVRKQHNDGNRHKHNVCEYYRQYVGQQLQDEINDLVENFQLKVEQGLIRPTYGLPPVNKTTPRDSNAMKDDKVPASLPDQPTTNGGSPIAANTTSNPSIPPTVKTDPDKMETNFNVPAAT